MSSRILVIDDNPLDVDLLREAFADAALAAEIVHAPTGVEAIALIGRLAASGGAPALIVLDLSMPMLEGREVLRRLRVHPRLRALPVVVLTSSQRASDRDECLALGAQDVITKPATFDRYPEVIERVRQALRPLVAG